MLRDTEQPGEPERGQQRVAAFGLGYEKTNRDRTIDVLDDLRHRHHQLGRRGLFGKQRAEIDRHRLHRVQRGIDGDEQGPPVRRVLRRVGDAQPLAHHVVDLRRVQSRVRVRQGHPVRHQPGPRHAQREARVVVRHLDRFLEQLQQRLRGDQCRLPLVHDRLREGGDARRIGRVGRQRELRFDGLTRHGHTRGERGHRRQCRKLRLQAQQLQPLHLQPQPQRVPPADVGAPVGVVANPGRQHDGARHQFGPAVRPGGAGHRQHRRIQPVERVAAVLDRGDRLGELVFQRDRRRAMRVE